MERNLRFGPADAIIYSRFIHRAKWTLEEAACLLAGYELDEFRYGTQETEEEIAAGQRIVRMESALKEALEQLQRSESDLSPVEWVGLAHNRGLPVPKVLVRYFPNSVSIFDRCKDLESELAKVRAIQAEVATAPNAERALGKRERDSLLKLVIGMACRGYKYDPFAPRSDVISEIASDLNQNGVGLDEDTVRKYLHEAAQLLPKKAEES